MLTIKEEISYLCSKYYNKLLEHPNMLAINLLIPLQNIIFQRPESLDLNIIPLLLLTHCYCSFFRYLFTIGYSSDCAKCIAKNLHSVAHIFIYWIWRGSAVIAFDLFSVAGNILLTRMTVQIKCKCNTSATNKSSIRPTSSSRL